MTYLEAKEPTIILHQYHMDEMENQAHTDISYQGLIVDNRKTLFVSKTEDVPNSL